MRDNARRLLQRAVKRGEIEKPMTCEKCGFTASAPREIHGHHEDYGEPLNVDWLCQPCHSERHRELPWEPESFGLRTSRVRTVVFPVELDEQLKRTARREGCSVSDLIRRACLRQYVWPLEDMASSIRPAVDEERGVSMV